MNSLRLQHWKRTLLRCLPFYPWQTAGLILILAIPILALFGFFGQTHRMEQMTSDSLRMALDYEARLRTGNSQRLSLRIENQGNSASSPLHLALSQEYLHPFTRISMGGLAPVMEDGLWKLTIPSIPPGMSRQWMLEAQADRSGRTEGMLRITPDEHPPVTFPLSTYIFF